MNAMDKNRKIILAGVWEQVNIPICICSERGIFKKYGIDVEFRKVPEGTGKMLDMIEEGSVDLAITVADAFIAGKAKGRPIQICGTWVQSPLVWAIAGAGANSSTDTFGELGQRKMNNKEDLNFGISRLGSGSHTMAFYLAQQNNIPKPSLSFAVQNDFKGLRKGVNEGSVDAFLWELFTTKPWFDSQELSYLGEVSTPWPAFVFVSKTSADSLLSRGETDSDTDSDGVHEVKASEGGSALSQEKARLIRECLFPALAEGVAIFRAEARASFLGEGQVPPSIQRIMDDFGHTEADALAWFSKCSYSADASMRVNYTQLLQSVETLKTVGLVPDKFTVDKLWTSATGEVNPVITKDIPVQGCLCIVR